MLRHAPLLLLALLAACDDYILKIEGGSDAGRVDDILALTGDVASGGDLFGTECQSCHPAGGTSQGVGPNLSEVAPTLTDADLVDVMIHGAPAKDGFAAMPPRSLEDQEAADILAWLRDQFGPGPS